MSCCREMALKIDVLFEVWFFKILTLYLIKLIWIKLFLFLVQFSGTARRLLYKILAGTVATDYKPATAIRIGHNV